MARQKLPHLIVFFLLFFSCLSCTKKQNDGSGPAELRIFTWSEYFDDAFLRSFGEQNKVKVKADYFSSNEEMLAKLQLTDAQNGYDLILPSDYMVRTLIELKLLQPLDKAQLPVLSEFEQEALNPEYDPGLGFSVPMAIGTTGIAWNTKLLHKIPADLSWKMVMENPSYKGKVTLVDDAKEVLQMALSIQGKSLAKASEADVKEAFAYLRKHKTQVKGFPAETRPVMEGDECGFCMAYSGDVLSVAKEKKEIQYLLPKEGATIWTDNLAIPANSKNSGMAYKFINALLNAEGAKSFTQRTRYRTANFKARILLPNEVSSDKVIYPSPEERKKMHYLVQRKDLNELIDREWTKLKSE
ncbi:MAG TPA: spermidine/putrescine ABC transporter substrate-binding protein [Bdellovibrionota bacterium]|jgi:spermidine/putrescine transport system substrate-binding protein